MKRVTINIKSRGREKKPGFSFKKLDPLKHMSRIEAELDDIDDDVTDAVPFEEIKDSAAYVRELRKLRKITWR